MNLETVEKNIQYQNDIKEIATCLFSSFYSNYYDEEFIEFLPVGDDSLIEDEKYKKETIELLMFQAERIFQFFENVKEAKKTIKFLSLINQKKAKEIIEEFTSV